MSALEAGFYIGRGSPVVHYEAIGAPGASSGGTSVAPDASANTKGAWVELGTTTIDADGFYVQPNGGEVADDYLFDIGTGAALSEVAILENVLISAAPGATGFGEPTGFYVPLPIDAGTRIACRTQCSQASGANLSISLVMALGGEYWYRRKSRATTYGANTADSGGTSIDPGGSANTDPATWTQISAAVTNPIESLIMCIGNQQNTARTTASWRLALGLGPASSEVTVIPDTQLRATDINDIVAPITHERSAYWPDGSRLAARARCSITDATDRLFDLVVIGFD